MEYLIIYFLLIFFSLRFDFYKHKKYKDLAFRFMLIVFISLSGLRYYVGSDTFDYVSQYALYPTINELSGSFMPFFRYEPGWIVFMSLCKTLTDNFVLPQLIVATIIFLPLFRIIKRYSVAPFLCLLIMFPSEVCFGFMFEFMRETFAVGLFLFSLKYYEENKWIKYYLIVILAITLHFSAFVLLFFPFLKMMKITEKNFILSIVVIFLVVFLLGKQLINDIGSLFSTLEGGGLSAKIAAVGASEKVGASNMNFLLFMYSSSLFIPIVVLYFSFKKKVNLPFLHFQFLYFVFIISSILTSEFYRFSHYLFVFLCIGLSSCVYYFLRKSRFYLLLLLFPIVLNLNYFYTLFFTDKSYTGTTPSYTRYVPYTSVFSNELSPEQRYFLNYYY